jgi:hypothetical protein
MITLQESSTNPLEGYFWIIDNKVVGITAEVPRYGYRYELDGKTHENTWNLFRDKYKVDGKEVDYDYFPRGRIMVDPNYTDNGEFINYGVIVMLDQCINKTEYKELIYDYYNLNNRS